jgi:hypothetical protein
MDPITAGIVGGVAGAATGKFIEKAWDSGEKWLSSYYADHAPKTIEKAKENSRDFIAKLALKVDALEEESEINKEIFGKAMEEPNFGVLLQKALIGSAQSENPDKHDILASLVSQRLKATSESLFTVASQMACDAITHCTYKQLQILGFQVSLTSIQAGFISAPIHERTQFLELAKHWFTSRFKPYRELSIHQLDLAHLESLSCLSFVALANRSIDKVLEGNWKNDKFTLKEEDLKEFEVGPDIIKVWSEGNLGNIRLTTVGLVIGTLASDHIAKAKPTNFDQWNQI